MPELPEVEALALDLAGRLNDRAIVKVHVAAFSALKTFDPPLQALEGTMVDGVTRHGKFLDVSASGLHLVLHLARAGWVRWRDEVPALPPKPSNKSPLAVRVVLDDQSGLDVTEAGTRKSLAMYVVRDPADVPGIASLGPDPLTDDFTIELFRKILADAGRSQIKGVLRHQGTIAGIGNAYSDEKAWRNIAILLEVRDSAVHFYNRSPAFALRLHEVGAASVKNFVAVLDDWFKRDLSGFNLYLLPLSFGGMPPRSDALLNTEEKKFLSYLAAVEPKTADPSGRFSVTVNVEVKFVRSKSRDAIPVVVTRDRKAMAIQLSEEQIREKYPWDYKRLTAECRKRYSDFKLVDDYHELRNKLLADPRFGTVRYLDPGNPKSSKKPLFDPNILAEIDKHYTRK